MISVKSTLLANAISVKSIEDQQLKESLDNLGNLLGGTQELNVSDVNPAQFDSFGQGLKKLFSINKEVESKLSNSILQKINKPIKGVKSRYTITKKVT